MSDQSLDPRAKAGRLKSMLALQNQLLLPLMPLAIDTFARGLILRHKLPWYSIPDLVTLLVTFAFFCLGLLFSVKSTSIASDDELYMNEELVRQKLLGIAVFSMMLAGGISFYRAFDDAYDFLKLGEENGFIMLVVSVSFVIFNLINISSKYIRYVGGNS